MNSSKNLTFINIDTMSSNSKHGLILFVCMIQALINFVLMFVTKMLQNSHTSQIQDSMKTHCGKESISLCPQLALYLARVGPTCDVHLLLKIKASLITPTPPLYECQLSLFDTRSLSYKTRFNILVDVVKQSHETWNTFTYIILFYWLYQVGTRLSDGI